MTSAQGSLVEGDFDREVQEGAEAGRKRRLAVVATDRLHEALGCALGTEVVGAGPCSRVQ
ncbi:MAG: hypothetical protein C4305_02435 [Thermoleophilia bacterium]